MNKFFALVFLALPLAAADDATPVDRLLDRIFDREKSFLDSIRQRTPLIETYIQETLDSAPPDAHPNKDHYFLGRFRMGDTVAYEALVDRSDASAAPKGRHAPKNPPMSFLPRGFAQMAIMDLHDFNRQTYTLRLCPPRVPGRRPLPGVRCGAASTPASPANSWDASGWRIAITRSFASTAPTISRRPPRALSPSATSTSTAGASNRAPGEWVPAQIYVEEEPRPLGTIADRHAAASRRSRASGTTLPPRQQAGGADQHPGGQRRRR